MDTSGLCSRSACSLTGLRDVGLQSSVVPFPKNTGYRRTFSTTKKGCWLCVAEFTIDCNGYVKYIQLAAVGKTGNVRNVFYFVLVTLFLLVSHMPA